MKRIIIPLIFLILINSALAATIHGTVYDDSLNVLKDTIVEVDSTPNQRVLAKDGKYSFTLPAGEYTITTSYEGQKTEEKITITDDGDYVLDLFLFPSFEDEDELLEETGYISIEDEYFEEETVTSNQAFITIIIVFSVILIGLILFFLKSRKDDIKSGIEDIDDKTELEKYLDFIKRNDGRTTQKEIRKHFGMSEAKISLVITELEHDGKIKKIKKGRSNIIILKKD